MKCSTRFVDTVWLLGAVGVAFALRVYHLGFQSLWYDESYGAYWAKKPLVEILSNTAEFHPPGFYVLLAGQNWVAGDSEFALRFVGVLFGVALVALVYALARRVGGAGAGIIAAWLAAISPMLVAYAQELRMYGPETTLTVLSTLLLWDAAFRGGARRWAAYAVVSAAALYLDYFPALILAAQALALSVVVPGQRVMRLDKRPWSRCRGDSGCPHGARPPVEADSLNPEGEPPARPYKSTKAAGATPLSAAPISVVRDRSWKRGAAFVLAQVAALALFLPWVRVLLRQAGGYGTGRELQLSALGILQDLWSSFVVGSSVDLPGRDAVLLIAGAGCVIAIAGLVVGTRRSLAATGFAVFLPVAAVGGFLVLSAFRPFYHARFLMVALPYFLVLVGLGSVPLPHFRRLAQVSNERATLLGTVAAGLVWLPAVLLVPAALVGLSGYYWDLRLAKLDARSPAEFLRREASADDVVIWGAQSPLAYYYRGPAHLAFFPAVTEGTADQLGKVVAGKRRVFWEASNLVDNDPGGIVPWLLTRAGRQLGDAWVGGYNLRWWAAADSERYLMPTLEHVDWRFEDDAAVVGAAFGPAEGLNIAPADGFVWVKIDLQVAKPKPSGLKYFVRLLAPDGTEAGRIDGWIRDQQHRPTGVWKEPGDGVAYGLLLPTAGTAPARYSVSLGLYRDGGRQISLVGGATAEGKLGEIDVVRPRGAQALPVAVQRIRGPSVGGNGRSVTLVGFIPPAMDATAGELKSTVLYWAVAPGSSVPASVRLRVGSEETVFTPAGGLDVSDWPEGALVRQRVQFRSIIPGSHTVDLLVGDETVRLGNIEIRSRPSPLTFPPDLVPIAARLAQGTELVGYRLVGEGDSVRLEVFWRASGPFPGNRQSFVHVLDPEGRIVSQADGPLGDGAIPADSLLPGDVLADRRTLKVPAGASHRILVGVYDGVSGQREPVAGGGDFVELVRIEQPSVR